MLLPLLAAATLTLSPDTVTQCAPGGLGRVTLTWEGAAAQSDVRVASPQGNSMTGVVGGSGTAESGDWVTDNMTFFLTSGATVQASATAKVRCGGQEQGRLTASYFPLQVGNRWVYRMDSRAQTAAYVIWTVTGTELLDGRLYFTLTASPGASTRLRADSDGRILAHAASAMERVYLDPSQAERTSIVLPLGAFPDSILTRTESGGLLREEAIYARGIGLVKSTSTLLSGSSGGFTSGLELAEAHLDGGIRLVRPVATMNLSIENNVLNVSGRKVTNCAIPSYCVACGLVGADPPGTYKPCVQVRVESPAPVEIDFRDAAGSFAYRAPSSPDLFRYLQIPLYLSPNVPLPPGAYRLSATGADGNQATLPVRIQ